MTRPVTGQRTPRGAARAAAGRARHHRSAAPARLRHRCQLLSPGPARRGRGRRRATTMQRACSAACAAMRRAADLPRRGHQPVRPGDLRLGAGAARRRVPPDRRARRRRGDPPRACGDRRARQPRAGAARPQDRPRPGVDRRRQDRRHRGQQRQRHVLRHAREQLSHAGRGAGDAGRRRGAGHRGRGERGGVPRFARRPAAGTGPARAADPGRSRARRAHPAQVPDEEHHRLRAQRAGRLRRSGADPRAPDDRLRRHARASCRRSPTARCRTTPTRRRR